MINNNNKYNCKVDTWAIGIGIIAYEMLTGHVPLNGFIDEDKKIEDTNVLYENILYS